MKTIAMPVNARNGSVAEDVTHSFLKAQLRDENSPPRRAGFVQYDIDGWTRPGPDLPADRVAVSEVVRDERRLHTYIVHVVMYTAQEVKPEPSMSRTCERAMTSRDCPRGHDWVGGTAYVRPLDTDHS